MLAQLKKTPVAAALMFMAACSVCFLPAVIAAIAAGGLVAGAGGLMGNAWVMAAGIVLLVGTVASSAWLMRRNRDQCASAPKVDA